MGIHTTRRRLAVMGAVLAVMFGLSQPLAFADVSATDVVAIADTATGGISQPTPDAAVDSDADVVATSGPASDLTGPVSEATSPGAETVSDAAPAVAGGGGSETTSAVVQAVTQSALGSTETGSDVAAQARSDGAQSASRVVESVVHATEAASDNAQAADTSAGLTSRAALPEPVHGTSGGAPSAISSVTGVIADPTPNGGGQEISDASSMASQVVNGVTSPPTGSTSPAALGEGVSVPEFGAVALVSLPKAQLINRNSAGPGVVAAVVRVDQHADQALGEPVGPSIAQTAVINRSVRSTWMPEPSSVAGTAALDTRSQGGLTERREGGAGVLAVASAPRAQAGQPQDQSPCRDGLMCSLTTEVSSASPLVDAAASIIRFLASTGVDLRFAIAFVLAMAVVGGLALDATRRRPAGPADLVRFQTPGESLRPADAWAFP